MIQTLKRKSSIMFLLFLLGLASCEKEELIDDVTEDPINKSIYNIETISHVDATVNPYFSSKFNEVNALLNPIAKSGTYYDSENDFYIYTDEVKHITVGDYESFTYSVKTKPEEKVIKNLFFSKVSATEYKSFLVTYDLSQNNIHSLINGTEIINSEFISYKEIKTNFFSKIDISGDCVSQETLVHCIQDGSGGYHEWNEDGVEYTCNGSLSLETVVTIDAGCLSGGGGGGSGGGGSGGGGSGGGGSGTCTSCPLPDSGSNDQEPSDPDDNNDNDNNRPVDCLALDENGECLGDVTVLLLEPIDEEFNNFANEIEFYNQNPCSPENYNCIVRIQKMADGLRKFHGLEGILMADYFESMLDDLDPSNYADVRAFTITANEITRQFNIQMRDAILGAYVDGVTPIIEIALFEVGGTFAIKLLQKIPLSWVLRGTRLNKVVKKVGLLGMRGTNNTIREYRVANPASRGSEMFKTITKDKIGQIEILSPGVRRANMGNGNFITFRDAIGSRSGAPATIELNFSEIFAQVRTVKFINP